MQREIKISPKVYKSHQKGTIRISVLGDEYDLSIPAEIRIQAMEQYDIRHSKDYCIKEPERYEYSQMKMVSDYVYEFDYEFTYEQKYLISFRVPDVLRYESFVYSLDSDISELQVFRGDTHIHTNGSDGLEDPFTVACNYRRAGFDFIAVTDHHKMPPSVELKREIDPLTDEFTVFRGEEVHNKSMGYFHIVNFDGEISVNDIIETDDDFVNSEIERIIKTHTFDEGADPYYCAYRIFISEQIRKGGGLAILPHPYWICCGEYNCQTNDLRYLLKNKHFDVFEVFGGCDKKWYGNNLQLSMWTELCADVGYISVVGASDSHTSYEGDGLFNRQFSLVFANDRKEIKKAIKDGFSVAVGKHGEGEYIAAGKFRLVKYARFLLDEYFPRYEKYTQTHAELLEKSRETDITNSLRESEAKIREFKKDFFGF